MSDIKFIVYTDSLGAVETPTESNYVRKISGDVT